MAKTESQKLEEKQSRWQVNSGALMLIILSYGTQFIAHFQHLPIWLLVFMPAISIYCFSCHKEYLPHAGPILRKLLTFFFVFVFLAYYRTNFSIEMAVAFLLLSTGLKLLELKTKRDCFLFIFSTLYLMSSALLFAQGFLTTLYQIMSVVLAMLALLMLHSDWQKVRQMSLFGSLFKWMGLAVPLILILFLFFPRIAPLWSIPVKAGGAVTGISDRMSPGDIAELSNSSDRAFRAVFSGDLPPRSEWYWRGVTLDLFDGREWQASEILKSNFRERIDTGRVTETTSSSYQVLMEPTQQRWAFALANSSIQSTNVYLNAAGMVRFDTELLQPATYQLGLRDTAISQIESYPVFTLGLQTDNPITRKDIQTPFRRNPKTREFAQALLEENPSQIDYLKAVLDRFQQTEYFYTLKPPVTGDSFVDDFLFDTKRGFCAHYAGATAYLLRLAGIPARVVVGYMGGEYIAEQDYVLVHQYDAHGWVEAHIDGYGWLRIDPTAMVAPSRILDGLESAVSEEGSFLEGNPFAEAARAFGALNWMRLELEKLNFRWQKWVVGFDSDAQKGLFDDLLGGYSLTKVGYILALSLTLMSGLVLIFLLRDKQAKKLSPAVKAYKKWNKKMSKLGFQRQSGETPRQFLLRIKASDKVDFAKAKQVTEAIEQLEYQDLPEDSRQQYFQQLKKSMV